MKKSNQSAIFDFLKDQAGSFLRNQDNGGGYLKFISMIWDIDNLPSTDPRFETMRDDITQHTINNDDWDLDELFIYKLGLYEDIDVFVKFVELSVYPLFCSSIKDIEYFVGAINPYLEDDGVTLQIANHSDTDYPDFTSGEPPIYKIYDFDIINNLPRDIVLNTIPFYVGNPESTNANSPNSVKLLYKTPAFVLNHFRHWNDYNWETIFYLFFYDEKGVQNIGKVKIMSTNSLKTIEDIPESFTQLNSLFCSLGQSDDFYFDLRNKFPDSYMSILYALRDAAFFPKIQEDFERHRGFIDSLLRNTGADRILRLIRHRMEGRNIDNLYDFQYLYTPPYSDSPINVHFGFKTPKNSTDRVFAVIGENGVGKTQLISQLPISIAEGNSELFDPHIPLFSKIIAVSYSAFDDFKIPQRNVHFNYHHSGLRKENGEHYTPKGLIDRFHRSWKQIAYLERINRWRKILLNFITKEILDLFIIFKGDVNENEYEDQMDLHNNKYVVDKSGFKKARDVMSSGQNILLYIITEIVGNIRPDSLILYDEPETHLHPNAISRLVNAIYELVNDFESFCLIATHSPIVIRELSSKNVFIMERDGNTTSVKRIGLECFGENISVLTDIVFGNRSVNKQFSSIIKEQVDLDKSFDEIVDLFNSGRPLSLNVRLHIQSLINEKNA